jgi:hypothetical protein
MPEAITLTDSQIRDIRPEEKPIKVTDGGGLYLEVTPSGAKHWRYRFHLEGKRACSASTEADGLSGYFLGIVFQGKCGR